MVGECSNHNQRRPFRLALALFFRDVELAGSRSTTIGRSSKQVNVVLDVAPIKSISRRHAEVVVSTDGGGYTTFVLRDLVSATNLP